MNQGDRGFVLVCVLWVLALLTVLAVSQGQRALLDRRAAAFCLDQLQAQYMARGATQRGMAELTNQGAVNLSLGKLGKPPAQRVFHPVHLLTEGNYYDLSGSEELDEERCTVAIEAVDGRISVNHAPEAILDHIEGLSFVAVDEILRRRGGKAPNPDHQPFVGIEELRYLEGIDDTTWYGDKERPGLRDILTCWGDGRINVNETSEAVLRCIPDLSEEAITAVMTHRRGPDGLLATADDLTFRSISEILEKTGTAPEDADALWRYCKVDSQFFRITALATQRHGKVQASCTAIVLVQLNGAVTLLQWREGMLGA
jgi:type II secretory pathway component PulK